jgi:hypothetical protein
VAVAAVVVAAAAEVAAVVAVVEDAGDKPRIRWRKKYENEA